MEKMRFTIEGLGRFIIFRGKQIRTPCTIDTNNKTEIDFLKFYLKTTGINYSIQPTPKPEQIQNNSIIETVKEEKKRQKKKAISILEKLTVDETIEGL